MVGMQGQNVAVAGVEKRTNQTNDTNNPQNLTYEQGQEGGKKSMLDFKLLKPYYPQEVTEFFTQVAPGFFEGNVMKYVIRCEHPARKDKKLEDIEKALTYINMIGDQVRVNPEKRSCVYQLPLLKEWQLDVIDGLMAGDLSSCITILWCARNLCTFGRPDQDIMGYLKIIDSPETQETTEEVGKGTFAEPCIEPFAEPDV